MFGLLRGMFALAIWDAPGAPWCSPATAWGRSRSSTAHDGGRLTFASELKALLALPERDVPRQVDAIALDQYLTYGYVPQPRTILEGVHKLPPAHFARLARRRDFRSSGTGIPIGTAKGGGRSETTPTSCGRRSPTRSASR